MALQSRPRQVYAIALGGNRRSRYGSPAAALRAAIAALDGLGEVECASAIRASPALGPAGRAFANAAVLLATRLEPPELLSALKAIERRFGRRPGMKWGSRVLDLDIILWSNGCWGGPGPVIPHSEFRVRDFVLAPLVEIAPAWRDPVSHLTMRQLLVRLHRSLPRADPVEPDLLHA
ncbi:MAG: 2-amino-4-hydroxy-6-hydroxymethyldihydropteridine diphosphokinase [Sphingosinicella sp.]